MDHPLGFLQEMDNGAAVEMTVGDLQTDPSRVMVLSHLTCLQLTPSPMRNCLLWFQLKN